MKSYLVYRHVIGETRSVKVESIISVANGKIENAYLPSTVSFPINDEKDETILSVIKKNYGETHSVKSGYSQDFSIVRTGLPVGYCYPRIYRPLYNVNQISSVRDQLYGRAIEFPIQDRAVFYGAIAQAEYLFDLLKKIFRVVQPDKGIQEAYGIEIRNFIILACTEVEAQWKGILKANGYTNTRFTTREYVKLLPKLKLASYKLRMRLYPKLDSVAPYTNWKSAQPTQSLSWYDAYNAIKHDREKSFHKANIKTAIDAMAGLVIILFAQYGEEIFRASELKNYFIVEDYTNWNPEECYFVPGNWENWVFEEMDI